MRLRSSLGSFTLPCWLALAGCNDSVFLGSECPELEVAGPCGAEQIPEDGGARRPDAASDARANPPDARSAPNDASVRQDAGGDDPDLDDDPDALLNLLMNPSFELLPDAEPGLVTSGRLPPTWTSIEPWYTCQPFGSDMAGPLSAVRAEREVALEANDGGAGQIVQASDGETFIGIQYLLGAVPFPLVQALPRSLPAGTKVGLAIDVMVSRATSAISLQVWGGRDYACVPGDPDQQYILAASEPITSTVWKRVCLPITVREGMTHLALVTDFNPGLFENDRLFFDNLRSVRECDGADASDEGS